MFRLDREYLWVEAVVAVVQAAAAIRMAAIQVEAVVAVAEQAATVVE